MTDGLLIEWGRANRGRVWHLVSPGDAPFCAQQVAGMKEVTQELPPVGATVCERCAEVVDELNVAVIRAQGQRRDSRPLLEPLPPTPTDSLTGPAPLV